LILISKPKWQITKQISKVNGEAVFSAALTVTNEFGEVWILALVATKAHAEFESALVKMCESPSIYGHSQPKVFYTDNPTTDKSFLESIFLSLTKGVIPVEKYPTLHPYSLPPNIGYSICSTATAINGACARILDDLEPSDPSAYLQPALDAELMSTWPMVVDHLPLQDTQTYN